MVVVDVAQDHIVNVVGFETTLGERGSHIRLGGDRFPAFDVCLENVGVEARIAADAEVEDQASGLGAGCVLYEEGQGGHREFDIWIGRNHEEFLRDREASSVEGVDRNCCHGRRTLSALPEM